jgi:acyl carrier protein phosphodiesterase
MNYLAHSYLSFNNDDVLIGNMISDFVKGKKQYEFSIAIQRGIQLHRAIDTFTDAHTITKEGIRILKPAVGLYAGAFVDVVYDHFLAKDLVEFPGEALFIHAANTYRVLDKHIDLLPAKLQMMLPFMKSQNWLFNYKETWGAEKSFGGVMRRAKYLTDSTSVFELFMKNYKAFEQLYADFFPDVKNFAFHHFTKSGHK